MVKTCENNGKPYEQMDDLGVPGYIGVPSFLETHIYHLSNLSSQAAIRISCRHLEELARPAPSGISWCHGNPVNRDPPFMAYEIIPV